VDKPNPRVDADGGSVLIARPTPLRRWGWFIAGVVYVAGVAALLATVLHPYIAAAYFWITGPATVVKGLWFVWRSGQQIRLDFPRQTIEFRNCPRGWWFVPVLFPSRRSGPIPLDECRAVFGLGFPVPHFAVVRHDHTYYVINLGFVEPASRNAVKLALMGRSGTEVDAKLHGLVTVVEYFVILLSAVAMVGLGAALSLHLKAPGTP